MSILLIQTALAADPAEEGAPADAPPEEEALARGDAMVVTAARGEQALSDVVVPTDLIDRAQIEASGAQTLDELLSTRPGVRIVPMNEWINVLDPGFNLHLREDRIAEAWVVRKPTEDGIVTSLELFDAGGETIALLFGARKPGSPEREDWRALIEQLR